MGKLDVFEADNFSALHHKVEEYLEKLKIAPKGSFKLGGYDYLCFAVITPDGKEHPVSNYGGIPVWKKIALALVDSQLSEYYQHSLRRLIHDWWIDQRLEMF